MNVQGSDEPTTSECDCAGVVACCFPLGEAEKNVQCSVDGRVACIQQRKSDPHVVVRLEVQAC